MPAAAQPARDAPDDLLDDVRAQLAKREVIEEEERVRAGDDDVVDAGVHEVDPDRLVPAERQRDLQLRADSVRAADEDRIRVRGRVEAEQRPEATDPAEDRGRGG